MPPKVDNSGKGVFGPATNIPFEILWKAFEDKIKNPAKYIPGISSVHCEDREGYVYREMTFNGNTMKEDIYSFKDKGRVEFRVVDADMVVVNAYHADSTMVEYFVEDRAGNKLGWWDFPGAREGTVATIETLYKEALKL